MFYIRHKSSCGRMPSCYHIVNASDLLELNGTTRDESMASSFRNETISLGNAGSIFISSENLKLHQGGRISTATYGLGMGGDITANAQDLIELREVSPVNRLASFIASETYSNGLAGRLNLQAKQLRLINGANF